MWYCAKARFIDQLACYPAIPGLFLCAHRLSRFLLYWSTAGHMQVLSFMLIHFHSRSGAVHLHPFLFTGNQALRYEVPFRVHFFEIHEIWARILIMVPEFEASATRTISWIGSISGCSVYLGISSFAVCRCSFFSSKERVEQVLSRWCWYFSFCVWFLSLPSFPLWCIGLSVSSLLTFYCLQLHLLWLLRFSDWRMFSALFAVLLDEQLCWGFANFFYCSFLLQALAGPIFHCVVFLAVFAAFVGCHFVRLFSNNNLMKGHYFIWAIW